MTTDIQTVAEWEEAGAEWRIRSFCTEGGARIYMQRKSLLGETMDVFIGDWEAACWDGSIHPISLHRLSDRAFKCLASVFVPFHLWLNRWRKPYAERLGQVITNLRAIPARWADKQIGLAIEAKRVADLARSGATPDAL